MNVRRSERERIRVIEPNAHITTVEKKFFVFTIASKRVGLIIDKKSLVLAYFFVDIIEQRRAEDEF